VALAVRHNRVYDWLQVHPYTFRNEAQYLAYDFNVSARAEYDVFFKEMGIDGAFTDNAATMVDYLKQAKLEGYEFDQCIHC
jgi:glycerophosphoryl diester phosphodiesterase